MCCCQPCLLVFFLKGNKEKHPVAAGSYKKNDSINWNFYTQRWAKNGCPELANPCYVPSVLSFLPISGTSLRRLIVENVLCGKHKQASCQDSATKIVIIKQQWILLLSRNSSRFARCWQHAQLVWLCCKNVVIILLSYEIHGFFNNVVERLLKH